MQHPYPYEGNYDKRGVNKTVTLSHDKIQLKILCK